MNSEDHLIPLTPAMFYILLALASPKRHGYENMKQVKQDSHGQATRSTGTLYGSLKRILADGRIAEAGERADPALDDERHRDYRLTDCTRPGSSDVRIIPAAGRRLSG